MWFFYALATTLLWGCADLFYKKGSGREDKYSHLKITVMVGFVMGIHATVTLLSYPAFDPMDFIRYLPVSAMYISSMMVGYFGLRYLELSIASPVQNTSGAVASLLCMAFLGTAVMGVELAGIIAATAGVVLLGVFDRESSDKVDSRFAFGAGALIFPLIYCLLDGLGTFGDALVLDEWEIVSEESGLIAYEYTFFAVAVVIAVYLVAVKKEELRLLEQKPRIIAAVLETAGQYFYVYAMSGRAVIAAPMIAGYAAVSALLSAVFLKERLKAKQYIAVGAVLLGIVLMGLAEGLAEA